MQMGERSGPQLLALAPVMHQFVVWSSVERQSVVAAARSIAGKGIRRLRWRNLDWLIHILKHGTIDALLQFQFLTYVIVEHLLDQLFQILCFWRQTPIHCLLQDIRPVLSWRGNPRPFGQSLSSTSDVSEWIC
jgi:hypothetical protein